MLLLPARIPAGSRGGTGLALARSWVAEDLQARNLLLLGNLPGALVEGL
jgi:hypothetical protein